MADANGRYVHAYPGFGNRVGAFVTRILMPSVALVEFDGDL